MFETETPPRCQTERAILHALLYFEIFSYPLTAAEVFHFANCPGVSPEKIVEKLEELVGQGQVFRIQNFYLTKNEPAWVANRHANNARADEFLPIARRMGRFIGAFPFIRGVFVSGSLSKHCMAPDSDIDFFLVTHPGRLWLARTLLVLFKKTFLLNSHKYFCVNYFVDSEHLEIEEKNLFTAIETTTLLPMYGRDCFDEFRSTNDWVNGYFPNFPERSLEETPAHRRGFFKKSTEWLLSGWLGEKLDSLAMRLTVGFWRRKFRHFDDQTFGSAIKSRRYVSKHHPLYFQRKVLLAFEEKTRQLEG